MVVLNTNVSKTKYLTVNLVGEKPHTINYEVLRTDMP